MKQQSTTLAKRGLRPVAELAANKPHGDRLRYLAGCRCADCRRANTSYENARAKARKNGEWNGIVSATKARRHLRQLSKKGVGRRAVQAASDVADTILNEINTGRKKNIRASTERKILAVTTAAAGDRALIPAGPTWTLINELLADGYKKIDLVRYLKLKNKGLQLGRDQITVRNAHKVKRMYEALRSTDAKSTHWWLDCLRIEGYTQGMIERRLAELAKSEGQDMPSLEFGDRIPIKAAKLIEKLYRKLTR